MYFVIFLFKHNGRRLSLPSYPLSPLDICSFHFSLFHPPLSPIVSQTSIEKLYKRFVVSKPQARHATSSWHGTPVVSPPHQCFMAIKSYKSIVFTRISTPSPHHYISVVFSLKRKCTLLLW